MASPCTTNATVWAAGLSVEAKALATVLQEIHQAINRERTRRSLNVYESDPELNVGYTITYQKFIDIFNKLEATRNVLNADIAFPTRYGKITPASLQSLRLKINTVEYECTCNCNYINAGYTCTCNYYKRLCSCTYNTLCACNTQWSCVSYSGNYYCSTNVAPPTEI